MSVCLCPANAQLNGASLANTPVRSVNITRKEKEYQGMLEYKMGDEGPLLKNVVTGVFSLFCRG